MTRYRLILNPAAGGGTARALVPRIEQLLRELGLEHELVLTEKPWHAAELARIAASETDVVVAAGGDGTANEVLNGLLKAKDEGHTAAMGVLCIGRGNDFAFGMGIPHELEAGCRTLAADHRRRIDVGFARGGDDPDGRYFGNGIGIGFDAVVGFVAARLKRLRGFAGYFVAAIKTMFIYFTAPRVTIEYSGQSLDLHALMVSVMNGRRMGGGFMMAPHGCPDDGSLDLCIARQVSRPKVLYLIGRFIKGTQESHEAIHTAQTKSITVTATEGILPAHADGETLCTEGKHLEIQLVPQAIDIVCQPDGGSP